MDDLSNVDWGVLVIPSHKLAGLDGPFRLLPDRPVPPPMRRYRDGGGIVALIKPYTAWNVGSAPPLTWLGRLLAALMIYAPE